VWILCRKPTARISTEMEITRLYVNAIKVRIRNFLIWYTKWMKFFMTFSPIQRQEVQQKDIFDPTAMIAQLFCMHYLYGWAKSVRWRPITRILKILRGAQELIFYKKQSSWKFKIFLFLLGRGTTWTHPLHLYDFEQYIRVSSQWHVYNKSI